MTTGDTVAKWLTLKPNEYRDIVLCGRVFGGRYGESLQIPRRYDYDKDVLRLYFDTTDVLTVVRPSPAFILGDDYLIIPDAEQATFGWHFYGREPTAENWCEQAYTRNFGRVHVVTTGSIVPHLPSHQMFQYNDDSL